MQLYGLVLVETTGGHLRVKVNVRSHFIKVLCVMSVGQTDAFLCLRAISRRITMQLYVLVLVETTRGHLRVKGNVRTHFINGD